jgi:hypothetical protein
LSFGSSSLASDSEWSVLFRLVDLDFQSLSESTSAVFYFLFGFELSSSSEDSFLALDLFDFSVSTHFT